MPVSNPIIAGNLLVTGLKGTFGDAYIRKYDGIGGRMARVMRMNVPSDALTEVYGYFESAPHPSIWPRGTVIKSEAMDSRQFSVTNLDWGKRIQWHRDDRADDRTGTLFSQAQSLGKNWAIRDERVFFQIITGAADPELLPAVPLAADGLAMFAAARFGTAGGNAVVGSGTSPIAISTDYEKVLARFQAFQDTKGQPLFDPEILDEGVVIIFNSTNREAFRKAFKQRTVEETVSAPSNVILDAGDKVTLWGTQRITDDSWYVFLEGDERKAIFSQSRESLQSEDGTMSNSDFSKDTGEEFVQWHDRQGYGIVLPYNAIKVSN